MKKYIPSEVKREIYKIYKELKIPSVYIKDEDLSVMSNRQLNMVLSGFKNDIKLYLALKKHYIISKINSYYLSMLFY